MAIPKHYEIRIPALKLLKGKGTLHLKDFLDPLAIEFSLTEEELSEMYPSGNAYIFYDRISWALSYLGVANLIERPKRAFYKITDKALELLKTPDKIDPYIKQKIEHKKNNNSKKEVNKKDFINNSSSEQTPQEELYESFSNIKKTIFQEILTTILSKTPYEFESLVVLLLQKMGYGGKVKNAGIVTKKSNDGGIDGVIKEDILGLGRIHIQAKRYKIGSSIGREEIQKFVGALAVAQSNKGVFITTSHFTKNAIEYADSLNGATTLVLIDGQQLAGYIYDFSLGMQVEETIEIKKLDTDFWDKMKDIT